MLTPTACPSTRTRAGRDSPCHRVRSTRTATCSAQGRSSRSRRSASTRRAGKTELFKLSEFLGFDRNVIVQATCHGADNSAMVDALRASGGRARGVATVRPDVTDEELALLDEAGVRGVRFNFVKRLVDPKPDGYYRDTVERIARLGWHVVLYFEAPDLADRWELFTAVATMVGMSTADYTAMMLAGGRSPDGQRSIRERR
jgi:predicted TIM-barrel fold metal-dependent hydrolase